MPLFKMQQCAQALTRLQLRCLVSFLFPFTLLFISAFVVYFQQIFDRSQLGLFIAECAKGSMEILWAYFPTIGAYAWFHQSWPKESKRKCLSYRKKRFLFLQLPLLVGLWFFTFWNIRSRISSEFTSTSWIAGVFLEFEWISLQAFSIFAWIQDNWKKESRKSKGEKWSKNQRTTVFLFLVPLFILITLCLMAHSFRNFGMTFAFQVAEGLENALFVYFPGMQIYVWMRRNWNRKVDSDHIPQLVENR